VIDCVTPRRDGAPRVLGVDACTKGWVGITSDVRGYFGVTITDLVAAVVQDGAVEVVAIDIPIGLPTTGPRQADALARRLVGRRASSVFSTPVRAALAAATHAEATAISVQATGKGLSQQAYALGRKILEVDEWARTAHHPVIEVHPEVCFAAMSGGPLRHRKSSWAGAEERRAILARAGITVPSDLGVAGEMAGPDDVLDAAAAAWTATRYAVGDAVSYPPVPERFGDGFEAAIWA
jgi:predicted RNase H-like nuclease